MSATRRIKNTHKPVTTEHIMHSRVWDELTIKVIVKLLLLVLLIIPLTVSGQENPTPGISLHMAALQGNIDAVGSILKQVQT